MDNAVGKVESNAGRPAGWRRSGRTTARTTIVAWCCIATVVLIAILIGTFLAVVRPWDRGIPVAFAPEPQLIPDGRDAGFQAFAGGGGGSSSTVNHAPLVHVNMTTIPERFASDWFADNMRRTLTLMRGQFVWWCNVPPVFDYTGEPYIVNDKVRRLLVDFPNFRLFHTEKDYGPITKVLGPLYNPEIPMTAPLLICDDDVQYLPEFVRVAAAHFRRDPTRVFSFCGSGVIGFRGFIVQKGQCVGIPANMPPSCRRIDDDLLDLHFEGKTVPITYLGSRDGTCSLDASDWGDWHTVNHTALRNDDRALMVKKCVHDFRSSVGEFASVVVPHTR